mgnify:CR=1 FL=1
MKTLIFAHPHTLSFRAISDVFWTQNPQEVLHWTKANDLGILILDLDAYDKNFGNLHRSFVYIGFSKDPARLKQAKEIGFHFTISTHINFSSTLEQTFQNAKENLILLQENQRLRELLSQNQSDQEMSLLLGGISHDFNNILSIVLGSAKVLKHSSDLSASQNELITSIIDATTHGKELSKQLMQYQNKSLESCDINTVLYRIGNLIQKSLPSNVTLSISESTKILKNSTKLDLLLSNTNWKKL